MLGACDELDNKCQKSLIVNKDFGVLSLSVLPETVITFDGMLATLF